MFFLKVWMSLVLLLDLSCSNSIIQEGTQTKTSTSIDPVVLNPGVVKDLKVDASVLSSGKWQLSLTWTETDNTTSYDIKSGIVSKIYPDTYTGVKSPFVISGLEPGTAHYFVILSSGTVNNTTVTVTSSEFMFTIPIDAYIEKPGPFTMSAIPSDGQVLISWEKAERATFYVIQKGTSTGLYTKLVKSLAESPYIDKDVTNGTKLYYIVIAVNSKGSTNAIAEAVATPAVPATFGVVTATPGDASIALSWGPLTGAASYQIKRADSQVGPFSLVSTSNSNGFTDTGLTNGSTYYYIVSALDANDVVLTDSAVVNAVALAVPGLFTVTPTISSHQVQLSWTASIGASTYTVEYGSSTGSYPNIVSNNATSPMSVSGLTNNIPYYFKIIATNASGNTSSDELVLTPMTIPGSFTVTPTIGNQQIQLGWTSSAGALSYDLKYGAVSGQYTTTINNATNPFTITSLTNGATYYFKVTAINPAGIRNSSELALVPGPPGSFSITSTNNANGQVTLHWSAASGAASYTVEYGITSGVYDHSSSSLLTTQTTINNLVNDTPYYFKVIAYNGAGNVSTAEISSTPTNPPWVGIKSYNYGWVWSSAADTSGNIYLTGYTNSALPGQTQHAYADYFIAKHDNTGALVWLTQMGSIGTTLKSTIAKSISVDSSGNMYITGQTEGALHDQSQYGNSDYFVVKYDSSGNRLWTRQLGASGAYIEEGGIALDSTGNIYISGHIAFGALPSQASMGVRDYFIVKYDTNGNRIWIQQYGSGGDTIIGRNLAVDASDNIYVTGTTNGTFSGQTLSGNRDFFVAKYDTSGNRAWISQYGASGGGILYDTGVVVSGTNVFVSGTTSAAFAGNTQSGTRAVFLAKYNNSGNLQTLSQYNSGAADMECTTITKDFLGNVYISGFTAGSFDGQTKIGNYDFILMKYDSDGNKIFSKQDGVSSYNFFIRTLTSDSLNNIYISGGGSLGTFTVKYNSEGNMQ